MQGILWVINALGQTLQQMEQKIVLLEERLAALETPEPGAAAANGAGTLTDKPKRVRS